MPSLLLADILERYEKAYDEVKKQLFGRLHDIARAQLFPYQDATLGSTPNGARGPVGALPGETTTNSSSSSSSLGTDSGRGAAGLLTAAAAGSPVVPEVVSDK
jgi:hypothetical protein